MRVTKNTWKDWAESIAHPADIDEYSPAAMERMMKVLSPYIVDVKGVRSQFSARNSVELIDFQTPEEKQFYDAAWQRYEAIQQKIKGYGLEGGNSAFLILAQFTIFRKAAELCRAEYLADRGHADVLAGKAVCIAVSFKGTIRRITQIWIEKYGVSRDQISLIWGGGKTKKTKKQKNKEAFTKNEVMVELLKEMGLTLDQLGMADIDDYVDDDPNDEVTAKYRLGVQSAKERQIEIDKFQSGKSLYCCFTFKAGGVGLSLHHTDEATKQKVRRSRNNWAIVEDIPLIPTRERVCYLAPTFSAIELVQGLGRCPRLTSLSHTKQVVIFYAGTIEERVSAIVSQKLRCLRKVVRTRESWESCITGDTMPDERSNFGRKPAKATLNDEDDDEADGGGFFEDEDEEE